MVLILHQLFCVKWRLNERKIALNCHIYITLAFDLSFKNFTMKKLYFLILPFLLFLHGVTSAQISSLTDDFVVVQFEVDPDDWAQDIEAKLTLVYNGDSPTKLVWVRDILMIEEEWETAICDPVLCYFPHVNSMSFDVEPGEQFDIAAHLYPRTNPGDSAIVALELYDENDPDVKIDLTFHFTPMTTSTSGEVVSASSNPTLYPNPAHDLLNIKNDQRVTRVEFFNLLGQSIYSTPHNAGTSINIANLNNGMYFVKLMDENNAVVRTLRLNKR